MKRARDLAVEALALLLVAGAGFVVYRLAYSDTSDLMARLTISESGVLRREQDNYVVAEFMLRQALEGRQRKLGPDPFGNEMSPDASAAGWTIYVPATQEAYILGDGWNVAGIMDTWFASLGGIIDLGNSTCVVHADTRTGTDVLEGVPIGKGGLRAAVYIPGVDDY